MGLLSNYVIAIVPMLLPAWYLTDLLDDPVSVVGRWMHLAVLTMTGKSLASVGMVESPESLPSVPPVSSQLLAYIFVGILGYVLTNNLIPNIQVRRDYITDWSTRNSRVRFANFPASLTCTCLLPHVVIPAIYPAKRHLWQRFRETGNRSCREANVCLHLKFTFRMDNILVALRIS